MVLMDYSSIAMSSLMVRIGDYENDFDMIRHMIFNMIRRYNVEYREKYGEMVLCMDAADSWRRKQHSFYKAGRRKGREKSEHDWEAIFSMLNSVRDELINKSPFTVVRVDGAEADDVIGAICELNSNPEPILIISPDKDFVQLQRYPNVSQYSNLQKKFVHPDVDALTDLNEKIMRGDSGDGVPNVLSDDDTFIDESKRQTPLSKKKLAMLNEDPEALGTTVARNIIRNRDLIDLTRTPVEMKEEAMRQLAAGPKGSINSLMSVMTKHRMKLLLESLPDFEVKKFINNVHA